MDRTSSTLVFADRRTPTGGRAARSIRRWHTLGLCLWALVALSSCGAPGNGAGSSPVVLVYFKPGTTYSAAMIAMNDLGLRHSTPCRGSVAYPSGTPGTWVQWWSLDEKANFDSGGASLWVAPTVLAPDDWRDRLGSLPLVTQVRSSDNISCPVHRADVAPTPDEPYYVHANQGMTYARITFADGVMYGDALAATNDLGLRLADVCFERGKAGQPAGGTGHTGEERAFGDSHTLVVATTEDASTKWQEQVRGLPGVTELESPYAPVC